MGQDRYHHGDLRNALIESARRFIEHSGTTNLSLRAVAREAGVSPAAPYHHFSDRDAVLAAVAEQGFGELTMAMTRAARAARGEPHLTVLQETGIAYVRFALKNPQLFRLMFGGLFSDRSEYPDLKRTADRAFSVLQGLLGEEKGPAQAGRPPAAPALAAWATVHGLATLMIDGRLGRVPGQQRAAQITREVTRVLGRGLGSVLESQL